MSPVRSRASIPTFYLSIEKRADFALVGDPQEGEEDGFIVNYEEGKTREIMRKYTPPYLNQWRTRHDRLGSRVLRALDH